MEKEKIGDVYNKEIVEDYYSMTGRDVEPPEAMNDSDRYLFEILPKDLKGKTILVKNIVSDENLYTNKTSVSYSFKQMGKEQTFISKAEVDHDKDVIGYWAKFTLI